MPETLCRLRRGSNNSARTGCQNLCLRSLQDAAQSVTSRFINWQNLLLKRIGFARMPVFHTRPVSQLAEPSIFAR